MFKSFEPRKTEKAKCPQKKKKKNKKKNSTLPKTMPQAAGKNISVRGYVNFRWPLRLKQIGLCLFKKNNLPLQIGENVFNRFQRFQSLLQNSLTVDREC